MPKKEIIKVALVDDDDFVLKNIVKYFDITDKVNVVYQTTKPQVLLDAVQVKTVSFDCLVTDMRMPRIDGISLIKRLREQGYTGKAIILTSFNENHVLLKSMHNYVDGFLLKTCSAEALINAILAAMSGGVTIDPNSAANLRDSLSQLTENNLESQLTPDEAELVRYLRLGMKNVEIAQQLGISLDAVKQRLSRLYAKFGVGNRTKLLAKIAGY